MGKSGPKPRNVNTSRRTAARVEGWDVPGSITGEAAAAWSHLVKLIAAAGNLERTDPTLVEAYAINFSMMRRAHAEIESNGVTLTSRFGDTVVNPACAVANAASVRLKSIIGDLGLCPATSKYAAASEGKETPRDDKWGDLLVVG